MSDEIRTVLEELQQKRETVLHVLPQWRAKAAEATAIADQVEKKLADLDRAIAALSVPEVAKAEFADRIDRLSELVEAERELRAAMSNFEEAQRAVVQSAERLQDWADRWDDCRQRVLSVVADDDLTTQKATEYKLSDANDVMRRFCDEVELKREAIAALSVPEVAADDDWANSNLNANNPNAVTLATVERDAALSEFMKRPGVIRHDGITYPLEDGADVEFIRRNGIECRTNAPEYYTWKWSEYASSPGDIFAYRVLPIEPAEYEDPTAVAIAAYIEAEQADYPDLTDEQDAAIETATAEYQSTDGAEIVSGEPWSISASQPHAEESALAQSLPPLFKPEPPQPATPESLRAGGIVDSEASWWARKLTKEPA